MSGSDYTTTPYFALYKPIAGMDVGTWGLHWNSNADTLDSTLKAHDDALGAINGAFLPLSGGTVTGPVTFSSTTGQILIGGTALSGKTRFEFNPTNPRAGTAALFMNRQGTTTGTDDPQISSAVRVDHNGGPNQYRHTRYQTVIVSNPGAGANSGAWVHLYQMFTTANDSGGGNVLSYHQAVRTAVNSGTTKGANLWSGIFEARSQTELPSSQDGIIQALEVDVLANGADDLLPDNGRTAISVVIGQNNTSGAPVVVSNGVSFYRTGTGYYKRMIQAGAQYSQAVLDTRSATPVDATAHAIWLNTGHTIGLDDAGVAGQPKFAIRSTGTKVLIAVDGVDKFSIDASGNVRAAGTITGSVTP